MTDTELFLALARVRPTQITFQRVHGELIPPAVREIQHEGSPQYFVQVGGVWPEVTFDYKVGGVTTPRRVCIDRSKWAIYYGEMPVYLHPTWLFEAYDLELGRTNVFVVEYMTNLKLVYKDE